MNERATLQLLLLLLGVEVCWSVQRANELCRFASLSLLLTFAPPQCCLDLSPLRLAYRASAQPRLPLQLPAGTVSAERTRTTAMTHNSSVERSERAAHNASNGVRECGKKKEKNKKKQKKCCPAKLSGHSSV